MTADTNVVRASFLTGASPAAIGVAHLHGSAHQLDTLLHTLTARRDVPVGRVRLVRIPDLDDLIVTRVSDELAQLMPHGGPRIRQRLAERLEELGVTIEPPTPVDPRFAYPEARDEIEALMLKTLATAASPRAVDLLLAQPARWRSCTDWTAEDEARSQRLNRLLTPPRVVLIGPPNVGKSTLTNALAGRDATIAADQPGTTRDYTLTRLDLAGLVVDWFDTPGVRDTTDELEREAQRLARTLMDQADLLIAMTDHEQPWPALPREADLRIANKTDIASRDDDSVHARITATSGDGIASLVAAINAALIRSNDFTSTRPWRFSPMIAIPG